MPHPNRIELYLKGLELVHRFCELNTWLPVGVNLLPLKEWRVGACAYYRKDNIKICVEKCAPIGTGGRAWSYPGYVVDRTPYGVLAHELGHHIDFYKSKHRQAYYGDFSTALRGRTGEEPITTYAPNDAEWFAEIARLFITNPGLLRLIRPRTYKELVGVFEPLFLDSWDKRLAGAPERTINAARRKIEQAI